jgi:hypothetical protein
MDGYVRKFPVVQFLSRLLSTENGRGAMTVATTVFM